MFDALIIGGGVSSVSCALVLGSAHKKPFAENKKIGVIVHQKASSLQNAVFNNAYGIPKGKLGSELLTETTEQLKELYPHVVQIEDEKVLKIEKQTKGFLVETNKNKYTSKIVIIGIGAGNPFTIEGLENYVIPHKKLPLEKNRIQLKNEDHFVEEGIYVIGVLAGHRSQLAIASGSGASVATDVLTLWNEGKQTMVHEAVNK
ncbi:FAD-dependent oxidoreductase [Flavobacterium sp. N2270]|uniref:FAD-dependent oxidoreductase n=1 Tax=Flavobacterium sp. N2270 TaxID=2986831 RepID=UPI002224A8FD|nr:FAD-dependent oxidoreductase [Flavobacterium sp. N2270]